MRMTPQELASFGDSALLRWSYFFGVRFFLALWSFICWWTEMALFIKYDMAAYFPIYLTHWSFTIEVVYLSLAAYTTYKSPELRNLIDMNDEYAKVPRYVVVCWFLRNIIYVASFLVMLLYWTTDFPGYFTDSLNAFTTISMHTVNFVMMAIDIVLSRAPFRILHGYQPMLYGIVYIIFNAVYVFSGGVGNTGTNYIYPILNWLDNPRVAFAVGIAAPLIILPTMTVFLWFWWFLGQASSRGTPESSKGLVVNA